MHSTSHTKVYKPAVFKRRAPQIAPPKKKPQDPWFRSARMRYWLRCLRACPTRGSNDRYRFYKQESRQGPNMQRRKARRKLTKAQKGLWDK